MKQLMNINALINMTGLMSVNELERLAEVIEEKHEELHVQFKELTKRLGELPVLLKQADQSTSIDRSILKEQNRVLRKFHEDMRNDCSLEYAVLALENDMKNRQKNIDDTRGKRQAYESETNELMVIQNDTQKDMDALKKLLEIMELMKDQKMGEPSVRLTKGA